MAYTLDKEITVSVGDLKLHILKISNTDTTGATFMTTIREPLAAFGSGQTAGSAYVPISPDISNGVTNAPGRLITIDTSSATTRGIVCVLGR